MKVSVLLMIVSLFFLIPAFTQTSDRVTHEGINNPVDFSSLMFSAEYASNTNIMGVFNRETKQPSFSPSMAFFSKWGADFSVLGYFVDNSDDSLDHYTSELDLILGYSIKPTEILTIYPSYEHYFYSVNSNALKSMFTDDIRLDVDYDYKFFNIGISAGYFMGKQNAFYAAAHNYYRVNINRFLFRNVSLSIQPGIDANFGSYEYLNLYYIHELKEDPSLYVYLLSYPAIRHYIYYEKMRHPALTYKEILDNYLEEKAQDNFKLTTVGINLPVYFMMGSFGMNFGLYAQIPIGQPDYMTDDVQFFFDISLTYDLMFK